MVLIRCHDHRRHVNKPIIDIINKDKNNIKIKDNTRHYSIMIDNLINNENTTYSKLIGKDIIKPYKEPLHEEYLSLNENKNESVSFITMWVNSIPLNLK